jgi:DNA polymerase-4
MDETRTILHLDLDAFFCAVEEQRDPQLRGVAFAVGGRPEGRGVVSSCSYAARAFGVHSAMPMAQAIQLCPGLVIVPPYFPAYRKASQQVMATLREISPLLEQISIDEAFLDISAYPGPILELAKQTQGTIQRALGLPNSLGIASNKLVAKIATEVGKHRAPKGSSPNAITVVPAGEEAAFLAPLPVRMLWGVGPKTAARLAEIHILKIGELAEYTLIDLVRKFGKNGYELSLRARGIDPRPIVTEHEAKSISQEVTYPQDITDRQVLRHTLEEQSQHIARQLQRQGLHARTIKIKLRWPDFTTLTRQTTLETPTREAQVIAASAVQLFQQVWTPGRPVRLLGVGVSGLDSPPRQIGLWDVDWESERKIQDLLAEIQEKYGEDALSRGFHPDSKD